MIWTGRMMSAIPILLMLFAASTKLMKVPAVIEGMGKYGFSAGLVPIVGAIELVSTVLYVIPQTAVLGAILLTGVFGGAIVTNLRVGDPSGLAPLILGLIVWGGLWFRESRLRELIPVRRAGPRAD
jgi:DoxX-like protein